MAIGCGRGRAASARTLVSTSQVIDGLCQWIGAVATTGWRQGVPCLFASGGQLIEHIPNRAGRMAVTPTPKGLKLLGVDHEGDRPTAVGVQLRLLTGRLKQSLQVSPGFSG